jgi:hypothetical protein
MGVKQNGRRCNRPRAGATIVESSVALGVMCLFLFGILDVGLALVRLNSVTEAARRVTRMAITHGSKCKPTQGTWGPNELVLNADASHSAAQTARPYLPAMNWSQVEIRLQWLDGDSLPDSRVRATVSTTHYSIALGLFSSQGFRISGQSTMRIAH